MTTLSFGILTVSDTCFNKVKEDTAGPKLEEEVKKYFANSTFFKKIVPDDVTEIKEALELWTEYGYHVILTTGGTGLSPRDVTPEATRSVIEKEVPGITTAMVTRSMAVTDMAMLSRAVCGIKARTLIINLPGSAKGAVECFGFIKNSISHAVALLTDNKGLVENVHRLIQETATGDSKVKLNNVADRKRKSPYEMYEVAEALKIILKECTPSVEKEVIQFDQAIHRILAENIYAEDPVPAFPASIKDGYAVKASDGDGERAVRMAAAAGDQPCEEELKEGEVIRISTGAPIPAGADAVVQVEDTTVFKTSPDGTQEEVIRINVTPKKGQDIRSIGSDVPGSSLVLNMYDRITPAHIGVLAMLGKTEIRVIERKSVGILSTGNELKQPGEPLNPGQIRDCNKYTLTHLLKRYSYDSMDCGTAKDEPNSVKTALEKAFSANDIVITTGGVSMGEYDILKQVLVEDFDAIIHFGRVNMKPGKPTTFATLSYKGRVKIFFGLPGNPVSCGVTCLLFVIPALRFLERSKIYEFPVIKVPASGPLVNNDERPEYHRVRISKTVWGGLTATSTGNQISSRLNSLLGANGLAIVTKTDPQNSSFLHGNANIFDKISSSTNQQVQLGSSGSVFGKSLETNQQNPLVSFGTKQNPTFEQSSPSKNQQNVFSSFGSKQNETSGQSSSNTKQQSPLEKPSPCYYTIVFDDIY